MAVSKTTGTGAPAPETVLSPRKRVISIGDVYRCDGWSAAEIMWKHDEDGNIRNRLGLRWNGTDDSPGGNPSSHGYPTWFLIPEEIEDAVRAAIIAEASK